MIRLFASDLDGTLLNKEHMQDEVILQGLKTVMDQGGIVSSATGRPAWSMTPEFLPGTWSVCFNGAVVLDPDKNVRAAFPIDKKTVSLLLKTFPDLPLECCTVDRLFVRMPEENYWKYRYAARPGMKPFPGTVWPAVYDSSNEEILKHDIYKINMLYEIGKEPEELMRFLEEHQDLLTNAPSNPGLVELTQAGISKLTGIQKLCEINGISIEEAAVYGDGGNDVEMLKGIIHSYAPSTAYDTALEAAAEIIGPYDEYSVVNHMQSLMDLNNPEQ